LDLHKEECDYGFEKFGRNVESPAMSWTDDDFESYAVGKQNAGPDKDTIRNGDVIFQSKAPLISKEECQALIDEARQAIADGLKEGGEKGEDNRPSNSELGEAKVSVLPKAREWMKNELHAKLFPLLRDRFAVNDLTLHDALIIGYGYFGGGSRSQPIHRDSSLLSLNIALSPRADYEGGGTYFESLGTNLHQEQGHITCHAGGILHAGHGISSGERWILVLFVLDESRPQLARRSHALALDAQRASDGATAKSHLAASLSVEPDNHLIYKDLGRTYMQEGDALKARLSLSTSTKLYPLDMEAGLGLAKMMWQSKRPRAALRRLDKLLANLGDTDLKPDAWMPLKGQGWEARVLAASCAIYCSQQRLEYRTLFLPDAIKRLQVCIDNSPAAPPPHVVNMLEAAQGMYQQALEEESNE
jgi:hypothetical protein